MRGRVVGGSRIVAVALAIGSVLPVLAACSVDNVGLLAAQVTPASGAVVVDLYYLGGAVRTSSFDSGGSLGFSKRSYIYPAALPDLPSPGWHWLHVSLPDAAPVAHSAQSYGLEGSVNVLGVSASLGYEAVTVLASVPADTSIAFRLSYAPSDPAATELSACEGIEGC